MKLNSYHHLAIKVEHYEGRHRMFGAILPKAYFPITDMKNGQTRVGCHFVPTKEWEKAKRDLREQSDFGCNADEAAAISKSIPADPATAYPNEWKGWNDFLGADVDPITGKPKP